ISQALKDDLLCSVCFFCLVGVWHLKSFGSVDGIHPTKSGATLRNIEAPEPGASRQVRGVGGLS
ncbi:MAG: hypothetical protein EBT92_19460, partial [Planctomycetes bacterium]|nr:hypothetical protein [Planctomycetota bacterium]